MSREFWIYQNGYHDHPWSMMVEVIRCDGQLIANFYIYCELLPGGHRYALILENLKYSRCWEYALVVWKSCESAGMKWSVDDFRQLERSLADIFSDCEGMKNERNGNRD